MVSVVINGIEFSFAPEDVLRAFAATTEGQWKDRKGIEPFWYVIVDNKGKPAKAVFRNMPGVPESLEFTKNDATRVFRKLGYQVESMRKGRERAPSEARYVWVIRAGKNGEQEASALEHGVAVIDYPEIGDLAKFVDRSSLEEAFRKAHPELTEQQLKVHVSHLWNFVHSVTEGALVLLPLKTKPGYVAVGEIEGDYEYGDDESGIAHARAVEWLGQIPKSQLPAEVLSAVDLPRTLYSIDDSGAERSLKRLLDRLARRDDPAAAKQLIEKLYPDADARKAILKTLADSIKYAHAISESVYTVNMASRRVRLMVGAPRVMRLGKESVVVLVDETRIPEEARERVVPLMDRTFEFRSVPNPLDIVIPYRDFASVYPLIRPAHEAMMQSAAKTLSIPHTRRAHSPGVIEYLRKELGVDVPDPVYPDIERPAPPLERTDALGPRAFELLAGLAEEPTSEYYSEHKTEFQEHVIRPFKGIMSEVGRRLRQEIRDLLEMEDGVYSRILKNDYGKGGAWPYYWGAFYPKGAKRTAAPQLAMGISHRGLQVSFFISDYDTVGDKRFAANVRKFRPNLEPLLSSIFSAGSLKVGSRAESNDEFVHGTASRRSDWRDLLNDPGEVNTAYLFIGRDQVVASTREELVSIVRETFEALFPLMILASDDSPMPEIESFLGERDPAKPLNPEFTLAEVSDATGIPVPTLNAWVDALERKKQAILYGPPGTGKTFVADHLARHLVGGGDGTSDLVQFHPAYAYEDFIQGLRPKKVESGGLEFELVDGRFREFCLKAEKCTGRCVFIIDEINRANLSRVFGELMYLLEYRDKDIPLASGRRLRIPGNVRVIGTMNTADRSIAVVDHALRRRFAFIRLNPDLELLESYLADSDVDAGALVKLLARLNAQINDENYSVGISYFLLDDLEKHIESIWRMEIEPYLEEYFFDRPTVVTEFRWDRVAKELDGDGNESS